MDYLQVAFPKLVKIITIGNTYEGKEMKLIQISSGRFNDGSTKPAMWIDGGTSDFFDLNLRTRISWI